MQRTTWIVIALAYLAFAEVLSWVPVPDLSLCLTHPEHSEQPANHDNKKYCPAFHMGAALAFEKIDTFLERHDKSVIGAFTIVLAISTIGLWLATNRLWAAGERQLRHLSETSERQLRAYIVEERARITDVEVGKFPKVEIQLRNTGQTPAYGLTATLGIGYLSRPIAKGQFPKLPDVSSYGSRLTLGRDQVIGHGVTKESTISEAELLTIKSGAGGLYVVGTVKYTDAFNLPRTTNFRLIYDAGDGQLSICEEGNESD